MKAIVCNAFGPVENLEYKEMPDPKAGKGQVVVDIKACGVNFPDGLIVQGLYQMKPEVPFIPGNEISDDEAAGLVTAHATAHHGLKQRANIQPGETLLVTGAAGGTGLAAVQIGKLMGAKVIAVCSTQEKLDMAKANGADILINYSEVDLKTAIKEVTNGKGVDVVYECVGGDTFHACSRSMAWNGRLLVVGFAGGTIPEFPVNLSLVKGYSVVGVFWGSFTQHQPQDFAQNMRELLTWYVQGKVKVVVDEALPLAQAKDALNKVMGREVKGKMSLNP